MARPRSIDEAELISRLAAVFRDAGYGAASLTLLSEATGLQKASLYHRFPGGKAQMADEVLAAALAWFGEHILSPLTADEAPKARLAAVSKKLDGFYAGGNKACLLNMLATPHLEDNPFARSIKGAITALIVAFAQLARDAGHPAKAARRRAERVVMLLQGSLVLSRGMGNGEPFRNFLAGLPEDLLKTA